MDKEHEKTFCQLDFVGTSCRTFHDALDRKKRLPKLTYEETEQLSLRWHNEGDEEALMQLFWEVSLIAAKTAWEYKKRIPKLDIDDVMSEAFLQTLKLVGSWSTEKERTMMLGNYVKTYLRKTISSEMAHLDPKLYASRGAYKKMRKARIDMQENFGPNITGRFDPENMEKLHELSNTHNFTLSEMFAIYHGWIADRVSLDSLGHIPNQDKDIYYDPEDSIDTGEEFEPWVNQLESKEDDGLYDPTDMQMLIDSLATSIPEVVENPKHIAIFARRYLKKEPDTLEYLSQEYSLSKERIRQISVRVFELTQKEMQRRFPEFVSNEYTRSPFADFLNHSICTSIILR